MGTHKILTLLLTLVFEQSAVKDIGYIHPDTIKSDW